MAMQGISRKPVPYVPEDDRSSPLDEQVVFWIQPKRGKEANISLARYAGAGKDDRKGYRKISTNKLDNADLEEFISIVSKVENYQFAPDNPRCEEGVLEELTTQIDLRTVCEEISADVLAEIFEASSNISVLRAGEKKSSSSPPSSTSGDL